jgi:hypothetical protein
VAIFVRALVWPLEPAQISALFSIRWLRVSLLS